MDHNSTQSVKWIPLRRCSHSRGELVRQALNYIERDMTEWSDMQWQAYSFLKAFLNDPTDVEAALQNHPGLGAEVVSKIGDLFLMGGPDGIPFVMGDNPAQDSVGDCGDYRALTVGERGSVEFICINSRHQNYQSAAKKNYRRMVVEDGLHEGVHAEFVRYERPPEESPTGLHEGWHLVAAAIERRAREIFNQDFDLGRAEELIYESRELNSVSLTPVQLRQCFDERFSVIPDTQTPVNHEGPIDGATAEEYIQRSASDFCLMDAQPEDLDEFR